MSNVTQIANHPQHGTQEFIWDQADRLMAVKNNAGLHHYVYDHTGTRLLKGSYTESILNVNGRIIGSEYTPAPYTVYTGPHMVCTFYADAVDVTKHYYTGGQRIASKLYQTPYGMDCPPEAPNELGEPSNKAEEPAPTINYIWCQQPVVRPDDIVITAFKEYILELYFENTSVPQTPQLPAATPSVLGSIAYAPCEELDWQNFNPEQQYQGGNLPYIDCLCRYNPEQAIALGINCQSYTQMYWYHPDYLGNTEFVTDAGGYPYQFFYYSAFGETLWQHDAETGNFATPYKFNAKEQDTETGNYYYGARYYNPQTSIWFGVDPLAAMYPHLTPYNFVEGNPIMLIDPTGMGSEDPTDPPKESTLGTWNESLGGYDGGKLGEVTVSANKPNHQENLSETVNCHMNNNLKNGKMNREDFIYNYRYGQGKSAIIPIGIINLEGITAESFEEPTYYYEDGGEKYPALQINFDQDFYKDIDHAFIFGTITLVLIEKNLIMALPDTYNFDLKNDYSSKGIVRNLGTFLGQAYNGVGNGFPIYIMGTKRIPYK